MVDNTADGRVLGIEVGATDGTTDDAVLGIKLGTRDGSALVGKTASAAFCAIIVAVQGRNASFG